MHRRPLGHLDDQRAAGRRFRRRYPEHTEVQRRLHTVRTDLGHEVGQRIQLRRVKPLRPPVVRHAKDKPPAPAVGQRRQPVGQVVPSRADDPVAAEANLLQLEKRVLTECDLLPQARCFDLHDP